MAERSRLPREPLPDLPRVIADFGGRRKILDRRHQPPTQHIPERRTGKDRRSGFDRRGALNQIHRDAPEKRHDFSNEAASMEPPASGAE